MSALEIIRLIVRYFHYIAGSAICLTLLVIFSTQDDKRVFETHTLLNTGLISGYSIESSGAGRIDYAKTNNELENLINLATSFETNKELSARLLARFLILDHQQKLPLLKQNYSDFLEVVKSLSIEVKVKDTELSILYDIISKRDADRANPFYQLTNSDNPFFGNKQLETILVAREGKSDMIRVEYKSIDPYLSQVTLELLTDIFIAEQKSNKEGQTDSVIGFFKSAVDQSDAKLKGAEDELLNFRVSNRIINYYEQTRFISGNKEELERQYQEELKVAAGAKSALSKIQVEIDDKSILPLLQSRIADNRTQISKQTTLLTQLELVMDTVPDNARTIRKSNLNGEITLLKQEMTDIADQLILVNQTPDGIETKELLTQWLNQTISKEESQAKLSVMTNRKREYEQIYDQFAPLGSTLKRLEREIDVAEREYLENLHSYNQARLHKYSSLMSSNLKVIDPPYYPIEPLKSKRMMIVILSFIIGAVLPAGLLIAMELLDSSLKNPENAMMETNLKVAGLLMKQPLNIENHKIDFQIVNKQSLNLLIQQLRAATKRINTPKKVNIFSMQHGEGKSFLIEQLNAYFAQYLTAEDIKDNLEFEFTEVGAIQYEQYQEKTLIEADVHLLVARANRKWTSADKHTLEVYTELSGKQPLMFLNGVSSDVVEEVIGAIPKRRSQLRALIHRLMTQGFKSATV